MNLKFLIPLILLATSSLSWAHLSYSGREFGTLIAGSWQQISSGNIAGTWGWAAGTDADLGDSHRLRAYSFTLVDPLTVRIQVQASLSNPGFLPAFSLYSGLAQVAPSALGHDGSPLSQQYLLDNYGAGMKGVFNALGDWAIGNEEAVGSPYASTLAYLTYIGHAADGTSANYGTAAGINGDGIADGYITATFNLAPGTYTIMVGGANLADEGPTFPNQSALITVSVVPEPSSAALLGLGAAGFALVRRRFRRA